MLLFITKHSKADQLRYLWASNCPAMTPAFRRLAQVDVGWRPVRFLQVPGIPEPVDYDNSVKAN